MSSSLYRKRSVSKILGEANIRLYHLTIKTKNCPREKIFIKSYNIKTMNGQENFIQLEELTQINWSILDTQNQTLRWKIRTRRKKTRIGGVVQQNYRIVKIQAISDLVLYIIMRLLRYCVQIIYVYAPTSQAGDQTI